MCIRDRRDVAFVRHDLVGRVGEVVELGADGGLDLGMQVAGVQHRDAAREVDVFLAVGVPQRGVLGAHGIEIAHDADAARRGQGTAGIQILILHLSLEWQVGGKTLL